MPKPRRATSNPIRAPNGAAKRQATTAKPRPASALPRLITQEAQEWDMSPEVFLAVVGMFFATILLVAGMKYVATAYAARARLDHDASLRELATQAVAAEVANRAALAEMRDQLVQLRHSLHSIEAILKAVE